MSHRAHLYLVGFMGSGKSTVGRIVAERLGRSFVDLDEIVVQESGKPITEIFDAEGEQGFRDRESAALATLEASEPLVVACGGGVVLRPKNREFLLRTGITVYLVVTAAEAIARVGDCSTRPLLSGPGGALAATSLLAARETLYRSAANITVDTSGRSANAVADDVVGEVEGLL